MFNWVEIDQPPASDAKALLLPALYAPLLLGIALLAAYLFFS